MANRSNPVTEEGMEDTQKATPNEKIVVQCHTWRHADMEAIADKRNVDKQRAEYLARRQLAKVIDDARAQSGKATPP